jgi:hypothetical protein
MGSMQPYLQLTKLSNSHGLVLWGGMLPSDIITSDRNSRRQQLGWGGLPI